MNWIKNKWQRFTRWQQQSPEYTMTNASVECLNCGTSYRGNYCPMCGQSAKVSRIMIHKVMSSITACNSVKYIGQNSLCRK